MGIATRKINRIERFLGYINKILKDREIDCDEIWQESDAVNKELENLAYPSENYISDSVAIGIESSERLIFAACQENVNEFLDRLEKRAEDLAADDAVTGIQIVFFVPNMQQRIQIEEIFNRSRRDQLKLRLKKSRSRNKNISLRYMFIIDQEYPAKDVRLRNLKRHEMVLMPPISGRMNQETEYTGSSLPDGIELPNSLIFNIDLFQLVELYNLVGDQLFRDNVRFGIRETLGVDQAIHNTLEDEPWYFWYKNNGITILVEDPEFRPRNVETLKLGSIGPDKTPDFSVVNGAQTITAAADWFFRMEHRCENNGDGEAKEKLKYAKETAYVTLRIIHIPKTSQPQKSMLAVKAISVALNRQKPIKTEDIAFTHPFVEKLAEYLERENKEFHLVRRGEERIQDTMNLVGFARARMACADKPGDARVKGTAQLLGVQMGEDGNYCFREKDIFVDEWLTANEEDEEKVFQRIYGAVWFAHRIAEKYDIHKTKMNNLSLDYLGIIRNGKWYFTALVVQMLNDFKYKDQSSDYSDFHCKADHIIEDIPKAMNSFADLVNSYVKKQNEQVPDSNTFKNNTLYENIIETIKGIPLTFEQDTLPSERFRRYTESLPSVHISNRVILGKKTEWVDSYATAMEITVEYILEKYKITTKLLKACAGWIGTDPSNNVSYFRSSRCIKANGTEYYVGVSSNSKRKYDQIKRLCELAGVPQNEIAWYDSKGEKVFSV